MTIGAAHVAFDLGAESGRAMVGRFDGGRIELTEVKRFPTRSVRLPDGLYWDALGLFSELTSALVEVRASGALVRSVGLDSWGVDFGLLDAHGSLHRQSLVAPRRPRRRHSSVRRCVACLRRTSMRPPVSSSCRSTRCFSCWRSKLTPH